MTTRDDEATVTLVTIDEVPTGREAAFRAWVEHVTTAASMFPGHLDDSLLQPHGAAERWVLSQRFRDHESAMAWTTSSERAALFECAREFGSADVAPRKLLGMETWCTNSHDVSTVAPPRWKMTVASFTAILPISLLGNGVVGPFLGAFPLPVRVLILAMLFSTLMTYLMMPTVTMVLRRWLYPAQ